VVGRSHGGVNVQPRALSKSVTYMFRSWDWYGSFPAIPFDPGRTPYVAIATRTEFRVDDSRVSAAATSCKRTQQSGAALDERVGLGNGPRAHRHHKWRAPSTYSAIVACDAW
jgi:hypothetical protein